MKEYFIPVISICMLGAFLTASCTTASVKETERLKQQVEDLKNQLAAKGEMAIDIRDQQEVLTLDINESILFDSGKADIKPEYYPMLNKIGIIVENTPEKLIQIEGHTDSTPISKKLQKKIPNNWILGAYRATNIALYLIEHYGVDPYRIVLVSFSKYHPVVENDSIVDKAKNRRTEVIILNKQSTKPSQEMMKEKGL